MVSPAAQRTSLGGNEVICTWLFLIRSLKRCAAYPYNEPSGLRCTDRFAEVATPPSVTASLLPFLPSTSPRMLTSFPRGRVTRATSARMEGGICNERTRGVKSDHSPFRTREKFSRTEQSVALSSFSGRSSVSIACGLGGDPVGRGTRAASILPQSPNCRWS